MGPMIHPISGLVFVFFWLAQELSARRRLGISPASINEFYRFGQKKLTPNPRYAALIFAVGTVFAFGFWESVLRFLLDIEVSLWLFVPGMFCAAVSLYSRRRNLMVASRAKLNIEDLAFLVLSWSLLMGAGGALLLVPWVFWRARFLPRRPTSFAAKVS